MIDLELKEYIAQCEKEYDEIIDNEIKDYNSFVQNLQSTYFTKPFTGVIVEYSPQTVAFIENIDKDETIDFTMFEYCLLQVSEKVFVKFNSLFKGLTKKEFKNICSIEYVEVDMKNFRPFVSKFLIEIPVFNLYKSKILDKVYYPKNSGIGARSIYVNPFEYNRILKDINNFPIWTSQAPSKAEFFQSKGLESKNGYWVKTTTC